MHKESCRLDFWLISKQLEGGRGYVGGGNFSWHDVCLWLTKLFKQCLCMSGIKPTTRSAPPPPFQSNFSCWKIMFKNMNYQSGSWSLGWKISVETAAGVFSVGVQWCRRTDVHIWWRHERRMFEEKKVWRAHSRTKKFHLYLTWQLECERWKLNLKMLTGGGGRSNTSHLTHVRWQKSGRASSEIPTLLVGKMSGLNRLSFVFLLNHFKDLNRSKKKRNPR